jgi:hypothetical protein
MSSPGTMLELSYDQNAVVLLARVSGTTSHDELLSFGRALATLDADAIARRRIPVTILIVIMSGDPPSAAQRRLMADLWKPIRAPLHLFALVSTSPVARGILKVVQWLNPPGAKRRESVHATFEDALSWAEKERGEPIPAFRALHAQIGQSPSAVKAASR